MICQGWTALTYAADAGHLAVTMYLLAKANVRACIDFRNCRDVGERGGRRCFWLPTNSLWMFLWKAQCRQILN